MSISKSGALVNSYKYFTIAVDSFENRLLKGRIFHDSMADGAAFGCLSEMVLALEGLFEAIHYPMKSVQQRNFNGKAPLAIPGEVFCGSRKAGDGREGALANFRLQVKFRYYASWQGTITDLKDGTSLSFISFMELMDYLDKRLGPPGREKGPGLGKQVCEVTIRSYDQYVIGGDVSHPAVENRLTFINEFELKEEIESMFAPAPEGGESRLVVPRTLQVTAGNIGPATFVVRVLFRRNGTWQGTISWKENRTQVSFRSFLEMLLLMHEAVNDGGRWKAEDTLEAAEMA
ncbi:MAG: hypothetical protein LIP16_08675 [Clostridium sp.]|nr:hypothetical protein [Clostridium sp.]